MNFIPKTDHREEIVSEKMRETAIHLNYACKVATRSKTMGCHPRRVIYDNVHREEALKRQTTTLHSTDDIEFARSRIEG